MMTKENNRTGDIASFFGSGDWESNKDRACLRFVAGFWNANLQKQADRWCAAKSGLPCVANPGYMQIQQLAVFCGSKEGRNPLYMQVAADLGRLMAARGITLVYGGGNKGLMGAVANGVMDHGGKAIGVIPEVLIAWEHQHEGLTELHVVPDMHVRKKMMYELCDAAVVLPGGHGTLDELFEMLTWNTLNIHNKKIILLNTAGYYTSLIEHMRVMTAQGFLYDNWEERLIVCTSAEEAIALFD
jgi:uncharacterized protein (TIGR00730 family)